MTMDAAERRKHFIEDAIEDIMDAAKGDLVRLIRWLKDNLERHDSEVRNAALEEAAKVADHLNGWGSHDGTAEHIAKCIREQKYIQK